MAAGEGAEGVACSRAQQRLLHTGPAGFAVFGVGTGKRCGRDEARQLGAPEGLGVGQALPAQPGDEVAIGARRRQDRRPTLAGRGVAGEQLAQQDRQRPAVEDRMVMGPDELAGLRAWGAELDQRQAEQRRRRKIEAAPAVDPQVLRQAFGLLRRRQAAPVVVLPGQREGRIDHLYRRIQFEPFERRAQGRVAVDHLLPALGERRALGRSEHGAEADARLHHVGARLR